MTVSTDTTLSGWILCFIVDTFLLFFNLSLTTVVDHCSNIKDPRLSLKFRNGPALNYSNDSHYWHYSISLNTLFHCRYPSCCFAIGVLTTVVDHCSNIKDPRLSLKFGMLNYSNDSHYWHYSISLNTLLHCRCLLVIFQFEFWPQWSINYCNDSHYWH